MGRQTSRGTSLQPRARRRAWWRAAILPLLPALLLACGGGASPTGAPTAASIPATIQATATVPAARTPTVPATASRATATSGVTATRAASPGATATEGTVNYPDVVRVAIDTLAAESGIPRDQISVARVEPHDWPDSSLGCPQPGRAYLQVITPGYRIFLAAGGRQYEYHTNQTGMVVRC